MGCLESYIFIGGVLNSSKFQFEQDQTKCIHKELSA